MNVNLEFAMDSTVRVNGCLSIRDFDVSNKHFIVCGWKEWSLVVDVMTSLLSFDR